MQTVRVHTGAGKFGQQISVGGHSLVADEPKESGGDDTGPTPHEFLLIGLGTCTSMTVKMYADRKGWPLRSVDVQVSAHHDEAKTFVIERVIQFEGDLDPDQRQRLMEIAEKCPVHKTLMGKIEIVSKLV